MEEDECTPSRPKSDSLIEHWINSPVEMCISTSKFLEFNPRPYAKLEGHHGGVSCLLKLNEDRFISGGDDTMLALWKLSKQKHIHVFTGHKTGICCLAKLNAEIIASGSLDGAIKLWNVKTFVCIRTTRHDGISSLLAYSENSLLIGDELGRSTLWNIDTEHEEGSHEISHLRVQNMVKYKNYILYAGGHTIDECDAPGNFKSHSIRSSALSKRDDILCVQNGTILCGSSSGAVRIYKEGKSLQLDLSYSVTAICSMDDDLVAFGLYATTSGIRSVMHEHEHAGLQIYNIEENRRIQGMLNAQHIVDAIIYLNGKLAISGRDSGDISLYGQ